MINKIHISVLLLIFLSLRGSTQNVEAFSSIDKDSILIGDQINYELGINVPEGFIVAWPPLVDTISKNIEIIDIQAVDTSYQENALILNKRLTLTSFDSGYFEIPSYTFRFRHENDSTNFESNTLRHFIRVYTPVVDTSQAFKAVKGPIGEPYTFREMLPWILLGLLIIGAVVFVLWYIRKRKKKKPLFSKKSKPELPAHIIAIQKLEEVRLAKVWQAGRIKVYHTQLTDIIREYMEKRYQFDAPEMTSDEIFEQLDQKDINNEVSAKLKSALKLADLVKFAKAKPTPLENDLSLNHCIDFVNETKVEPVLRVDEQPKSVTEMKEENDV